MQAQASARQNSAMMVSADRAADRRWRRLDDLERRRQEGQLVFGRRADSRFVGNGTIVLASFMDARLQIDAASHSGRRC